MTPENKTIVIYGVASGFGRALVKYLRSKKNNVIFSAPENDELKELLDCVSVCDDGAIHYFKDDDTFDHWNTQTKLINFAVQQYNHIDVIFSLAGVPDVPPSKNHSIEQFTEATLELNMASIVTLNRLAIRQFIKQGGIGCIVNTCPLIGTCGDLFDPLFFAAKSGIIGITKSYASLLESTNILVNCVVPDIQDSLAPMDGVGHLEWLSYDHCIKAYSDIIENTYASGYTLTITSKQASFNSFSKSDPVIDKLHQLSKARKNAFLEKVKDHLLVNM